MFSVSDFQRLQGILLVMPLLLVMPVQATVEMDASASRFASEFGTRQGLETIDDESLGLIEAQAGSLILMDKIEPNELSPSSSDYANFTYYRMGMDVKLDLNANISKLQLGCGGVNDLLTGTRGCDLDIDYVGFMGLNANNDRPGAPGSPFTLTRPFLEIAFKNANDPAKREAIGFRIGAQSINGAIRMGRDYTNVGYPDYTNSSGCITNQETGGGNCTSSATPITAGCNPAATTGMGVVGCHSGLNSISGYLGGLELSAGFKARARVCIDPTTITCGIPGNYITQDIDGCLGRIDFSPCTINDTPFFVDAGGTRITSLNVAAAKLNLSLTNLFGIDLEGYGRLNLNTRQVHYLLVPNSSGFFLSFQRERVSWPNYNKTTPAADFAALNPGTSNPAYYDACNPAFGQATARCNSAYAPAANTGWWLSANNAKMLNLRPGDRITLPGSLTIYQLLGALGPNTSNLIIDNPKLDFIAADNCYGSARFC